VRVISSLANILTPTAVALGNFDGVHQGHRQVIEPILNSTGACRDFAHSTVVTFNPHPQEFFTGESRCLLTPLDEKAIQLKALGVEQLVLLPFDRELASLSPEQFVQDILVNGLGARQVSVGLDFCFGKGRTGTVEDLKAIAARHGVEVMVAPLKLLNGDRISSSAIRHALQAGNIQHANYLLGRSYTLWGTVIHGQRLGRTLGFPTANLQLPAE
jgi:riboflavin kinase/FMN adenylyltransferase